MSFPFSDTTNKTGIVEDIDYHCETNSTSYPLADKARNVNRWLYKLIIWMFQSSPEWEWDDSNLTTHPIARTNLVDGQSDYSLPLDALRFQTSWVLDSSGNKHFLEQIGYDEYLRKTASASSNGIPEYICMRGASAYLFPAPDASQVTETNGLNFAISREPDLFTASDTTQEAGIPEPFCRVLSFGPAYEYWLRYDIQRANQYLAQIESYKNDLKKFNNTRVQDVKTRLIPYAAGRTRRYM